MSRMRLLLAAALLSLAAAPPASAAEPTAADSAYRDYRIPDHRWWQWTAGFGGSANHQDQTFPVDESIRSGSFQGQFVTSASGGHDSDPLLQTWALDVRVNGTRRHEEQSRQDPVGPVEGEVASRSVGEAFALAYGVRAYPWRFPLALSAATSQRLDLGQQFVSTDFQRQGATTLEQSLSSQSNGAWGYLGTLSLGTGVGRVRDATPVYEAQVLEERLLATGALARPLSRPARDRLAALITTGGRSKYAHDRPDKYFWGEVERILTEDGALASGALGLYDAHRLLEPETIRGRVVRAAGWFVGPAVFLSNAQTRRSLDRSQSLAVYQADTLLFESGSELHTSDYFRQDLVQTAVVAEYHHPAGPRWQYDAGSSTFIGESGVPLVTSTNAFVTWVVTDRWLATGGVTHGMEWSGHGADRGVEQWVVNVGASVSWFVEDAWAVSLSASENQAHSSTRFRRSGAVQVGITRVIGGLFEAPGLVAAMRPAPGGP